MGYPIIFFNLFKLFQHLKYMIIYRTVNFFDFDSFFSQILKIC